MLPPKLASLAVSLFLIFALGSAGNPLSGKLGRRQDESHRSPGISLGFFASLERLSRLVDITYCVGAGGISKPFSCASRCKDFPNLELVTSWNTGMLMSDSCGYVAVDHSSPLVEWGPSSHDETEDTHPAGAILVAFRGTYSLANTVADLSTIPQEYVPYPSPEDGGDQPPEEPDQRCTNCTVHTGFLTSWKAARKEVLSTLEPLHAAFPKYPIYLIGHSLGGAVAALAALEMKVILGWDNLVVTTFGEPRIGNSGFVKYLDEVFELDQDSIRNAEDSLYRRLTHVDDPVPLLPLYEWGYRSHAGEIFISKPDLAPEPEDIWPCEGDYDPQCIAGSDGEEASLLGDMIEKATPKDVEVKGEGAFLERRSPWRVPARYKLWQLFFAHRDYFWRLGLCVPGGDPFDWGRDRYPDLNSGGDEL